MPVADDAWLPVYDLARIKFEVQRDHVGQYVAKDGQIVCVAPIAARKQLAKEIHSRDDGISHSFQSYISSFSSIFLSFSSDQLGCLHWLS